MNVLVVGKGGREHALVWKVVPGGGAGDGSSQSDHDVLIVQKSRARD